MTETAISSSDWPAIAPTARLVCTTGLVGLSGWVALVLAAQFLGADGFARFAVLWAYFFGVAGLLFGLQQETSRAVAAGAGAMAIPTAKVARAALLPINLLVVVALAMGLASTSPWWAENVFGASWKLVMLGSILGLLSLAVQSSVAGTLAGRGQTDTLSALTAVGALMRVGAVLAACLTFTSSPWLLVGIASGSLAWALLLPSARVRASLFAVADVPPARFVAGAVLTMVASLCAALLAAGLPFLVTLASDAPLNKDSGPVFAAIIATRTPLLLPVNGLQLVLIAYLVRRRADVLGALARILVIVAAFGAMALVGAGSIGPALLRMLFGPEFVVERQILIGFTGGALALVILTVTGTALVALSRQLIATAGWLIAVAATWMALGQDLSLLDRCLWASFVGPVAGVLVHLTALIRPIGSASPPV